MHPIEMSVVTYNIHRCYGTDRKLNPARVLGVLQELRADIIGLQEVDSGHFIKGGNCQAEVISQLDGFESVIGPTIKTEEGRYGNLLMTRYPIVSYELLHLGYRFYEPRGAIVATLKAHEKLFNVINVHLGLSAAERRFQYHKITEVIANSHLPTIILGDFNEWMPMKRVLPALGIKASSHQLVRSFPSWRPMLALDRIYTYPGLNSEIVSMEVHRSELSRVASDHLPVKAVLRL